MAKREIDQETFSPRTFPLDAFEMREEGNQKTLIMIHPWALQGLEHMHPVSSTDYTILDDDGVTMLLVTTGASNRTITLPTAADNNGRVVTVVKVDSGAGLVIVDGEGSETIDGVTSITLYSQYNSLTLVSCGTYWSVIHCKIHGSTAVGNFRFEADGTLVQWGTHTVASLAISVAFMGGYRSSGGGSGVVTLPIPYIDANYSFSITSSVTAFGAVNGTITASTFDILWTAVASQSAAQRIARWITIGRWR